MKVMSARSTTSTLLNVHSVISKNYATNTRVGSFLICANTYAKFKLQALSQDLTSHYKLEPKEGDNEGVIPRNWKSYNIS